MESQDYGSVTKFPTIYHLKISHLKYKTREHLLKQYHNTQIQPLHPENYIGISCDASPCESVRVSVSWSYALFARDTAPPSPPAVSPALPPSSPSPAAAEPTTSSGGLTTGAIAGIIGALAAAGIIGALAAAVMIGLVIAIMYLVRPSRRGRPVPDDESKTSVDLRRCPQRSISMSVSHSEQVGVYAPIGTPIHEGVVPWKHSNESTSTLSVQWNEAVLRTPTSQEGPWRHANASTVSVGRQEGSSLPRLTGLWARSKTSLGRNSERSEGGVSDSFGKTVSAQVAPGACESTLRNPSTQRSFGRYFEDESLPRTSGRSEGRRRSGTSENSGRSVTSMFSWRRFGDDESEVGRAGHDVEV
ncbi:hypothetical protein BJ742DRAFT_742482 [Cladochytrium replicatum]|nr:hypothetical protein BJ742DRAFT_742482 [Cladochytrium replicatum]